MRCSILIQRSVLVAGLAVPLVATPATSQIITGRVRDATTGASVDAVEIVLLDTLAARQATVVTNKAGEFLILLRRPGTYLLRASRLGYASVETRPLEIGEDEALEVELRLDVRPVELEPLTVIVRRRESMRERDLREYYARVERYGRRAGGPIQIFTREDLEGWNAFTLSSFLDFSAPHWVSFGRECSPIVFVDGRPGLRHPYITVRNIEGIEFYRRYGPMSTRFWDPNLCGVILIWTRPKSEIEPLAFNFGQLLGAAAGIAVLTLLVF
jgi:hypothetical protein